MKIRRLAIIIKGELLSYILLGFITILVQLIKILVPFVS